MALGLKKGLKIADLRPAGTVRQTALEKRVEDNQAHVKKKKLIILYSAGVKLGLPL
jgi:hypothetical protein